ncbi:hypothetical protein scyTo_0021568 [Scyliorhinus torazame]|uniref:Uncharacterized protein n=1 Tax=Scyliorhinus torazame TaxID=75743 RepID=A0A401QA61_SCYTO|nr:hypothetical protein [Scyliorhinus torazame]
MGCTSSITTVQFAHQHPDVQINVIEPSTVTAMHGDTPSSGISVTQSSICKTSDVLKVTDIEKYGQCHSAIGQLVEPNRMFNEAWQLPSGCGKDEIGLPKRSQSAKSSSSEHGYCSYSKRTTTWAIGIDSKQDEKVMEIGPLLQSEQLDSLSLKEA